MIQRACRQFEMPVSQGAQTVGGANLTALAAANHSPVQLCHIVCPLKAD
jgi:hypothetical protein